MITSIPREISDPGLITKHFQYNASFIFTIIYLFLRGPALITVFRSISTPCSEAYPSCTVTDIRFCFDVNKLMLLDAERYFLSLRQNPS